ncbi:related to pterin-4-alpha-carbinolamine dehydratase [Pseudozyma flocculosa]|uniref:4a-hydroxytetrahydrobiopterin dehydratase n=2 Tax=Pseudozyma flocculosa TaxID=84751 RepID=A0A5C3ERJ9_9BASI|nr:related to pterin-4-alpha-carbinolamine dehydratase [Pseudozyma flocculosa]
MSSTGGRVSGSNPLPSKCEPCSRSAVPLGADEVEGLLQALDGWYLSPQPQTLRSAKQPNPDGLKKSFKFKDWSTAQTFVNALGQEAEAEGHHPAIMVEWGRVSVWWWSHSIKGLHKNDFIMASRTDMLAERADGYKPLKPKTP